MPNQKDIAKELGVSQTTVSRALHNDRTISPDMRRKVKATADRLGYHPNAYLTVLMSNIRKGKALADKGVIALLVEDRSLKDWYKIQTYRIFHQGVLQRAKELGFHIDTFFLKQTGMDSAKVDRILDARGIKGIILAPPYHGNRTLEIHWERYASIGAGFGWETQELNRVSTDTFENYIIAFNRLRQQGYRRIGTILFQIAVRGIGTRWYAAHLNCQNRIPENERIPVLEHPDAPFGASYSPETEKEMQAAFQVWYSKWKPDALLAVTDEKIEHWLATIDKKIPQDVGLACLAKTPDITSAGIDEMMEVVGATTVELVAAQIARNEFGLPDRQKIMLIEGRWAEGPTVRRQD